MPTTTNGPMLVVVAGPTAIGKTRLAIILASRFNTEILSADSRQFYREMRIGTAVPSGSELKDVRHHFIHHLSIHDHYNVSQYESDAVKALDELFRKHSVVIMAGGSGLYINAVCRGIDILPDPDPGIRMLLKEKLASEGIASLQEELQRLDPDYAGQVDLANPSRLIRALEVCRMTGLAYSSLRTNKSVQRRFRVLKLGLELPRDILYERINSRVDAMMEAGLYHEALSLYPFRQLNALNTVGYKELFDHFDGLASLEHSIEKIKTNSRRYAKRQMTWFKKDARYTWFQPSETERMVSLCEKELAG